MLYVRVAYELNVSEICSQMQLMLWKESLFQCLRCVFRFSAFFHIYYVFLIHFLIINTLYYHIFHYL